MNIVKNGNRYIVYGNDIQTFNKLPVGTYKVECNQMTGFYLLRQEDLDVREKIYGNCLKKAEKVMKSFKLSGRNMGILLSGPKGSGKSMFARAVSKYAYEAGMPVILSDTPYSGLADFISSISQECMVLFDEFEKNFHSDSDGHGPQDSLLALLDGVDSGKKLYIATCNNISALNECLLNRPGRFHYHFRLGMLDTKSCMEYLSDNLRGDAKQHVDDIIKAGALVGFTYDILRAITFDLNQGYSLAETMQDLNIEVERFILTSIRVTFTNGAVAETKQLYHLDLLDTENCVTLFMNKENVPEKYKKFCSSIEISFDSSDIFLGKHDLTIDPGSVELKWDYETEYYDESDGFGEEMKKTVKNFTNDFHIQEVIISRGFSKRTGARLDMLPF